MPARICPSCFHEIGSDAICCPACGADVAERCGQHHPAHLSPLPRLLHRDAMAFRSLIDDYADHAAAAEAIACIGEDAIAPLNCYLAEGPQVNPQGRLFAVAMLARLPLPVALDGLREVLHGTRLHDLPVSHYEAEYRVKNAVMARLAEGDYPERDVDIDFGARSERLIAAVAAAGRHGLATLAPELTQMLDDDVLERAAGEALLALGKAGEDAILRALPALFDSAEVSVRNRLALIRAMLVLWRRDATLHAWALERSARDAHPAVRAVGALFADPSRDGATEHLLHGALSDCRALADACQERLPTGSAALEDAARTLLRHGLVEPDIYGNTQSLSIDARHWLMRSAGMDASGGKPHCFTHP